MDTASILGLFEFFRDAPPALRGEMERSAKYVQLDQGNFYCHIGDPCTKVALLGRGRIRVFKTGENGREISLYHVTPGETCLLTLNGALTGQPYPASAVVEEEIEAAALPVANFKSWVDRDAALRRFIFDVMAHRLSDLMTLVDEVTFNRMDRRLGEFILDKIGKISPPQSTLAMTHDQIASELGTAREVISRLLKDLERQAIVSLGRGRVELLNEGRLRETIHRNGI